MRNRISYGVAALAGSALLVAGPASAAPVVTGTQVLSTAGSAAGGALGGPVGGFLGGLLGRQVAKVFQKKPPGLGAVETPAPAASVGPVPADKPLEIRTVDTTRTAIPTPPAAAAPFAQTQAAADVSSGAEPASGTLDAQLAALERRGEAPAAQ